MTSPIERLVDSVMHCTICDAPMGECDCWTRCSCGHSALKGFACRNPKSERCSTKMKFRTPYTHKDVRDAYKVATKLREQRA